MKNKLLVLTILALLGVVAGCVSVNSEKFEDRLSALKGITEEEDLFDAIEETQYNDIRNLAASRIRREDLSLRLLKRDDLLETVRTALVKNVKDETELSALVLDQDLPLACRKAALGAIEDNSHFLTFLQVTPPLEDWIREKAIPRVSDQPTLISIFRDKNSTVFVRELALAGIEKKEEILPVIMDRSDDDELRRKSFDKILLIDASARELEDNSHFLTFLQVTPPLEDWIREKAIPRVSDQPTLISIFRDKNSTVFIRKLALKRIGKEEDVLPVIMDRSDDDELRRMAVEKIYTEASARVILDKSPILEEWACMRAISLVSDPEKLSEVFLDRQFYDQVRLTAGDKISSSRKMQELFLASTDDLAARLSLRKMDKVGVHEEKFQQRLLKLFRSTSNSSLMYEAWRYLDPKTDFCLENDQRRIVAILKIGANESDVDRMLQSLFDDSCILELATGYNERLAKAALRLQPNPTTALQIAERARIPSIQCAALSFLEGEKDFARIAKFGTSRDVRVAAISRLSSASALLLSNLAADADPAVSKTAVRKLKMIGRGDVVADIEKKAEAERMAAIKEEARRIETERKFREERERRAEQKLKEEQLQILADSQIHSYRHYLAVLERFPDIGDRTFLFSGKVVQANGRKLGILVPQKGGGMFALEVKLLDKPVRKLMHDEIITISGRYRTGTQQSVELEKGSIVCFGILSEPLTKAGNPNP